ncbi:MAG: outer membrane protein assembly factor BamD [Pyrinomonadaceae bacterium]
MKKTVLAVTFAILSVLTFNFSASAQGRTIEPRVQRDPILEQDAMKNLEVARQYFTTKKAYKAVVLRLDEVIAAYPEFSRMDEVLYLFGISNLYLFEGKGRQKIDLAKLSPADKERFMPERLKEDAVANLSLLVEKFPESDFAKKAKEVLKTIDPQQASK